MLLIETFYLITNLTKYKQNKRSHFAILHSDNVAKGI
jgi:hypothetical protein